MKAILTLLVLLALSGCQKQKDNLAEPYWDIDPWDGWKNQSNAATMIDWSPTPEMVKAAQDAPGRAEDTEG